MEETNKGRSRNEIILEEKDGEDTNNFMSHIETLV